MKKLVYWIWLSICFSYGVGKPQQLVEDYDPEELYNNREILKNVEYLTKKDIDRIGKTPIKKAEAILSRCEELNIRVVTYENNEYPDKLKEIYGAPIVLYVQGDISYLNNMPKITIVGTRESTDYGKKISGNMSYLLSLAGMVVISGCARGVDEFAHRGALKSKGKTVGVLACGHDINYPVATQKLKNDILMNGGALIGELPPGTGVTKGYFHVRNRIMAGISDGTVVTEAPQPSGSQITANLANDMNRDVFCVPPADIFDKRFTGVVPILRDGAKAIYDVMDILEEYTVKYESQLDLQRIEKFDSAEEISYFLKEDEKPFKKRVKNPLRPSENRNEPPENLTANQSKIYNLLGNEPMHVDELTALSGLPCYEVLSILTELELVDAVTAHSGRRYSLN